MYISILEALLAFVLGTVLGSFANVLVVRLREASTIWGRSRCPDCGVMIRPRHLVPIVSWFYLRGRCADCGRRIHVLYPLVEAACGILALAAAVRHPFFLQTGEVGTFLFEALFAIVLVMLVAFDLRWQLLPVEFMAGITVVFGTWKVLLGTPIPSLAIGVAVGVLFLGAQVWLSRGRWMGSGDPWMGALLGAAFGWPGIGYALYLAYMIGGAAALVMLVSGAVKRGSRMPFAPFLALGAIGSLWFGQAMDQWVRRALGL